MKNIFRSITQKLSSIIKALWKSIKASSIPQRITVIALVVIMTVTLASFAVMNTERPVKPDSDDRATEENGTSSPVIDDFDDVIIFGEETTNTEDATSAIDAEEPKEVDTEDGTEKQTEEPATSTAVEDTPSESTVNASPSEESEKLATDPIEADEQQNNQQENVTSPSQNTTHTQTTLKPISTTAATTSAQTTSKPVSTTAATTTAQTEPKPVNTTAATTTAQTEPKPTETTAAVTTPTTTQKVDADPLPVLGKWTAKQKKYDYKGGNVTILHLKNESDEAYTVTINGKYLDADGKVIKMESKSFDGFPSDYENYFIFNPGFKYDSFTFQLDTKKYTKPTLAQYLVAGSTINVSTGWGPSDGSGEWKFPTSPAEEHLFDSYVCLFVNVEPFANTSDTRIEMAAAYAVFDSDGNLYHIHNSQVVGNFAPSESINDTGNAIPISATTCLWENKDQYTLPDNLKNSTGIMAVLYVKEW